MKILCVIPARGGSKGLPNKNTRLLAGRPLLAYSIAAACLDDHRSRCVVTTDSPTIAEIAREHGADVPFLRPEHLATDQAAMPAVVDHCLGWLLEHEGYQPELIVLLQPTSPLRSSTDVRRSIELLRQASCNSVVSVCEVDHPVEWSLKVDDHGGLQPRFPEAYDLRRQELPVTYRPNGAIYAVRTEAFLRTHSFEAPPARAYVMSRAASVDIDTLWDFELAEWMLQHHADKV